MNVLIACEFSGIVRDAFRRRGHHAWSCDVLPCERDCETHIQDDVRAHLDLDWDLMIAHPPCTHLAVSGARWFKDKATEQADAIRFVEMLWDAPIPRIAIENPVGVLPRLSRLGKATQYIQPWQFGHGETKKTGLWLKNLPPLEPTNVVEGREGRVWRMPPGPDRWKERSRTYAGVADAMAAAWGCLPNAGIDHLIRAMPAKPGRTVNDERALRVQVSSLGVAPT